MLTKNHDMFCSTSEMIKRRRISNPSQVLYETTHQIYICRVEQNSTREDIFLANTFWLADTHLRTVSSKQCCADFMIHWAINVGIRPIYAMVIIFLEAKDKKSRSQLVYMATQVCFNALDSQFIYKEKTQNTLCFLYHCNIVTKIIIKILLFLSANFEIGWQTFDGS